MTAPAEAPSADERLLASVVDVGRNALWNYVTLIVWLRARRRTRVIFNIIPLVLGSISSWQILTASENTGATYLTAICALLAGLLPLLYLASGAEEALNTNARVAGDYRALESRLRDLVFRFWAFPAARRLEIYQDAFDSYIELKKVAHTLPRWAFSDAEKLIAQQAYIPITVADAGAPPPEATA